LTVVRLGNDQEIFSRIIATSASKYKRIRAQASWVSGGRLTGRDQQMREPQPAPRITVRRVARFCVGGRRALEEEFGRQETAARD
jgi:hypothetical protein